MPKSDKSVDLIKDFSALLREHGLTPEEALAVLGGEALEQVRKRSALRKKLLREAGKYLRSSVDSWPFKAVLWDLAKASQRFCLDGYEESEFREYYPDGFRLGWVNAQDFDQLLAKFSHRTDEELWSVGSPRRLAYLIACIADGHKVSPVLAKPLDDGTIILTGGHHRYAIARALRQTPVPICLLPEHRDRIGKLIRIEWYVPER